MSNFIQQIFSSLKSHLFCNEISSLLRKNGSERDICFYEEEFNGIEILPLTKPNWDFLSNQAQEIYKFSEAHKAEVGWTDVYLTQSPPESISTTCILRNDLISCMPSTLPMFNRVRWTDGTRLTICQRTLAFGPHESLVLFTDLDNARLELIEKLWLRLDLQSQVDVDVAMELMRSLTRWPLMLYDSGWLQLIPLNDTDRLTTYLQQRVSVFGKVARN